MLALKARMKFAKKDRNKILNNYRKRFKEILEKNAKEGIEIIKQEIKKRNLVENEDIITYKIKNQKVSFTIDYDKANGDEVKVNGKAKLEEAIDPMMLQKLMPSDIPEKLQKGFMKGIKKTRERTIMDISKLNCETLASYS